MKRFTRVLLRQFARAARPYLQSHGLLRTSKVFNTSSLVWEPGAESVLVLAPHMDDETIGCGGALARHVKAGASVKVVFLTDGRHGGGSQLRALRGNARHAGEMELVATRKLEARQALEILGVPGMFFLDVEDGTLARDAAAATRLRAILEAERPELVYVPHFLEQHPDHYAASRILLEATRGAALRVQCVGYEVWTPLFPNCFVNIDEVVELKRRALGCYRSQLGELDYLHSALGLNAYRSAALSGHSGRFAEAFCSVPLRDYRLMFETYAGPG
jgi:LmbE family N-acetylglucosaminyl deacetylase